MSDKANSARDKLKALNSNLLKKRSQHTDPSPTSSPSSSTDDLPTVTPSSHSGGSSRGAALLSMLRQESTTSGITTTTPSGGEPASGIPIILTQSESTLSILRRESLIERKEGDLEKYQKEKAAKLAAPGGPAPTLLDVLQAGSTINVKKEEKAVPTRTFLTAGQQKRTLSTIKRSREEKMEAMEKLKSDLAAKRKHVEDEKKAKFEIEKSLATAVAGSVIMAPAIHQGSRAVGMPSFQLSPPSATPKPRSSMGKSRIAKKPASEEPAPTAKPSEPTLKRKDSKAAEFRKKQEEIRLAAKERTLLRKSKQLDKEQKQIHVDNQLNTLLASLLKLETAYREQEKERQESNRQMAELMNEKNEAEFLLDGTRAGIRRCSNVIQRMLDDFPFDKESEFYRKLQHQQREMQDMARTEWKVGDSPRTEETTTTTPTTTTPTTPAPPPPAQLAPTALSAPAAPAAPPPSAPAAPAAPPSFLMNSQTNFLAGIQGGVAGLKKVDAKDLEKNKTSNLGGIFESLHDTLTAAMEVRKLALADSDDEDEWDEDMDEDD